jgi:uncharacterized protein (TIGR02996 family)
VTAYNGPMTDATAAAIERAVLADPADRTAQLVYADRLDELGEADLAAAVRAEEFPAVAAVASGAGVSLRAAWEFAKAVRVLVVGGAVETARLTGAGLGVPGGVMAELIRAVGGGDAPG